MTEVSKEFCVVCGDQAIGHHYDALTCTSCKSFFKRNAPKYEEIQCVFGGNCVINVLTRKFCGSCRLRKCIAIGMKKDFIRNFKNKTKNKKVKQNRKQILISDSSDSFDSISGRSSESSDSKTDSFLTEIFENNNISEEEINEEINEIKSYISHKRFSYICDNVYQRAVEYELSVVPIARPISDYKNTLNESEGNKLNELLNATNLLNHNYSFGSTLEEKDLWNASAVCSSKTEEEIRKLIKMFKNLSSFQSICANDQIVLIKYGSPEINYMRLIKDFNYEHKYWTIVWNGRATIIKLDLFKECPRNIYKLHADYLDKIVPEWESDQIVMDLLTAIALFNPNRPNLIDRHVVKEEQHNYMYLLHRYLLLRYQWECESKSKFLRLLNSLEFLQILTKKNVRNIVERKPTVIGALLQEIYESYD